MAVEPVSILGGKSVYCINEGQLKDACALAQEGEAGERIQAELARIGENLSRNEQAALAFMIIENLRNSA
ncbi:MAG TPA: hypothetical protein DCR55_14690 [Lentisphaeria bacterium]|jgi:hypothetical protein|nr:hypothetical protein [Lentisphaeria bacterium]